MLHTSLTDFVHTVDDVWRGLAWILQLRWWISPNYIRSYFQFIKILLGCISSIIIVMQATGIQCIGRKFGETCNWSLSECCIWPVLYWFTCTFACIKNLDTWSMVIILVLMLILQGEEGYYKLGGNERVKNNLCYLLNSGCWICTARAGIADGFDSVHTP